MQSHIVIVGAGPGGLVASILMARLGAAVTLIERKNRVGGRSALFELDGFRFDTGPTFFLFPQVLEKVFTDCGLDLRDEIELMPVDPLYELFFENSGRLKVTQDREMLRREIARFAPEDAARLDNFFSDNGAKLEAFKPVLERMFSSYIDFLHPKVLWSLQWLRPYRSVDSDLARHFSDPRIRLAFSFQSKYLGMSPLNCPSLFTILSFIEHHFGIFHPKGGCGALMDKLAEIAQRLGVDLRLEEEVERLDFEGQKVTGVHTDKGSHRCDALVIGADFANAMTHLVPNHLRRRWTDAKIATKRFSCSTYMLYLGIKGKVDLAHHTILLAEDYERNLDEIEKLRILPSAPSLYVQNACVTDPGQAPEGHSTLYVLVPVPNTDAEVDWTLEAARYRRLVLDRLRCLGIENIEDRIVAERSITPAEWRSDLQLYKGATFNLAHSLDQMLMWRPNNRFEDLERVYLVGGGTQPGSGLPVIFEGARITTSLIARDLALGRARDPAARPAMPTAGRQEAEAR